MSIKISSLVRKYGPMNHSNFVVLLALADHANDAGMECWPSVKLIAFEMRIGKSSVLRSLKTLASDGWISVMRKSRDHKGNSYRIALEKLRSSPDMVSGDNTDSDAPLAPDSEVTETPEIPTSNATVTPEIQKSGVTQSIVRCQAGKSQVSPSALSGLKSPPLSINGPEQSRNRPEPSSLAWSDQKHRSMPEELTVFDLPFIGGKEYGVPKTLYDEYVKAFPGVSVMAELGKMRVWLLSNPTRKKTLKGMPRFMNWWLAKEQNNQPQQHGGRSYANLPVGKSDHNMGVLADSIAQDERENGTHEARRLSTGRDR